PHPSPYGGLCEIELLGDPADALATLADELNHLCLVSLRQSPSLPSLHRTLLPHFRAIRGVYGNGASSACPTPGYEAGHRRRGAADGHRHASHVAGRDRVPLDQPHHRNRLKALGERD